jgi:hypothetical protein
MARIYLFVKLLDSQKQGVDVRTQTFNGRALTAYFREPPDELSPVADEVIGPLLVDQGLRLPRCKRAYSHSHGATPMPLS